MPEPYIHIHHFDNTNQAVDEDGDVMLGYYYEIFNKNGIAVAGLMGPYSNQAEVEAASVRELKFYL